MVLCVLKARSVLQGAVCNSALAFYSCLGKASRSDRGRRLEYFQFFLEVCTALHMCLAFEIVKNVSELYSSTYGNISPQIFLLDFYSASYLTLTSTPPPAKVMAPHSSTLAWKIPWIRGLVGYSPWGSKESDMIELLHFHFHALEKEMATHFGVLAWRIPGTGEPGGLPSMGSHRVGHD